ncbi:HEPN domain-containing protein [Candidatus Gottesmanbacteria bacterium]|nr:HEPN domain-containing protein [Candidatus Gottesmanbacteria bacterium]
MTEKEAINYWLKSSNEDLITAESLYETKRYLPCLFFCHLFLEKILKALFIAQKNSAPPYSHDLLKLSQEIGLKLEKDTAEDLREISRFNIAARYDDYKFSMYKKATKKFTTLYYQKAKEIYLWLQEKL